jgi:uncharacterized membrane protein YgcG
MPRRTRHHSRPSNTAGRRCSSTGRPVYDGAVSGLALERRLGAALMGILLTLAGAAGASAAVGPLQQGKHVYDEAQILTTSDVANLETKAAGVEKAGARVVIYLQRADRTPAETRTDAAALMQAWSVESRPGAKDGLVIYLNLNPADPRHGAAAIYAGASQLSGRLPRRELDRIYTDVMAPQLASGRMVSGLADALDQFRRDLKNGPPYGTLLLLIALAGPVAALVLAADVARTRAGFPGIAKEPPAGTRPYGLAPALVGALVGRDIDTHLALATALEMARRGALLVEPSADEQGGAQIRLLDVSVVQSDIERQTWDGMAKLAEDGVVSGSQVKLLPSAWFPVEQIVRQELVGRGWADFDAAQRSTTHLWVISLLAFVLAVADAGVAIVAQDLRIGVGAGALAAISAVAFAMATKVPFGTRDGEQVAAPWRAYLEHAQDLARRDELGAELEFAMPYLVATKRTTPVARQLKRFDETRTWPSWLGPLEANGTAEGGDVYDTWTFLFMDSGAGGSGGASGSGDGMASSAGGAAAGGGGVDGSF